MSSHKINEDWIEKLYQPTFNIESWIDRAIGFDKLPKNKEVQVDLPRPNEDAVNRGAQTDALLWQSEDVVHLRRAFATQLEVVKQKYSAEGSPYDTKMQGLQAEVEEMRENWRSTQQLLEECQLELGKERAESERLRIAISGLKRYAAVQLADADDARWFAAFERASSSRSFKQRLEELQQQQERNTAERGRQQLQDARESRRLPSLLDLGTIYRNTETMKAENQRLQARLTEANEALTEYERAYKMLLKHVDVSKK